jgi:hypothetical protein
MRCTPTPPYTFETCIRTSLLHLHYTHKYSNPCTQRTLYSISCYSKYSTVRPVKTQQFIVRYISVATSFVLQIRHQAILSHNSSGTLSSGAHFWDPKMFTIIRGYGYKCGGIYDTHLYKCGGIYDTHLYKCGGIYDTHLYTHSHLLLNVPILMWLNMA